MQGSGGASPVTAKVNDALWPVSLRVRLSGVLTVTAPVASGVRYAVALRVAWASGVRVAVYVPVAGNVGMCRTQEEAQLANQLAPEGPFTVRSGEPPEGAQRHCPEPA